MAKQGDSVFEKQINCSPANVAMQFEVPRLKKMIKVTISTRSTIKQHLNLFSSKFDSDFSSFKIQACIKHRGEKKPI